MINYYQHYLQVFDGSVQPEDLVLSDNCRHSIKVEIELHLICQIDAGKLSNYLVTYELW